MTEERLRVESGPPQHMIDEPVDLSPDDGGEAGKAEQAREAGGQAREKVAEVAGPAKEKAREVAGEAKGHARAAAEQAKSQAAAQVDERSTQLGQQIGSQGEALDGVAGELRRQGKDGQAQVAEQAAERVKKAGDYLEQADGQSLVETASKLARDNPAAAAAVGAAAGFAAGRVLKASSPDDPGSPSGSTPASGPSSVDEPEAPS